LLGPNAEQAGSPNKSDRRGAYRIVFEKPVICYLRLFNTHCATVALQVVVQGILQNLDTVATNISSRLSPWAGKSWQNRYGELHGPYSYKVNIPHFFLRNSYTNQLSIDWYGNNISVIRCRLTVDMKISRGSIFARQHNAMIVSHCLSPGDNTLPHRSREDLRRRGNAELFTIVPVGKLERRRIPSSAGFLTTVCISRATVPFSANG
jgi:hypothetical protein